MENQRAETHSNIRKIERGSGKQRLQGVNLDETN